MAASACPFFGALQAVSALSDAVIDLIMPQYSNGHEAIEHLNAHLADPRLPSELFSAEDRAALQLRITRFLEYSNYVDHAGRTILGGTEPTGPVPEIAYDEERFLCALAEFVTDYRLRLRNNYKSQ